MRPGIEVAGRVAREHRERITWGAGRAVSALELDRLRVEVVNPRRVPRWMDAGAGPNGIWVRPSLARQDWQLLDFELYRQAAHYKLLLMGVEDTRTFAGALVRELFASWFQYRQLLTNSNYDSGILVVDRPLPHPHFPQFAEALGAVLGWALAGHGGAARLLRSWFDDGNVDPALKRIARRFERIVESDGTPSEVADRLARAYEALGLES